MLFKKPAKSFCRLNIYPIAILMPKITTHIQAEDAERIGATNILAPLLIHFSEKRAHYETS